MNNKVIQWWKSRRFLVEGNMISGQSKGCAVSVQVRYTRFVWFPQWAQERDIALVRVRLFAPKHNPEIGYRCLDFSARIGNMRLL